MAKRKEDPPSEGSPAWMSTFSDLMNLLLCFFVLLFASSTMDAEKIQKIAASFQTINFSIIKQGEITLEEGILVSGGVTQLPGVQSIMQEVGKASKETGHEIEQTKPSDEAGTMEEGTPQESTTESVQEQYEAEGKKQSEEMYEEISDLVESYDIEKNIQMDYDSQYVELNVNGAILFDSGDANVKDEAKFFMQKIGSILEKYKNCIIEIEGHTDNVPVHNSKFESNRYLSTARATKVYEYLMANADLNDENIKVAGYGESRPVAPNDTPEGRAKNRRVVIKIYNTQSSR